MAHETPGRHPMCTCPEVTFANLSTIDVAREREGCRRRAVFGDLAIDPHPVITCRDLHEMLQIYIRHDPEGPA